MSLMKDLIVDYEKYHAQKVWDRYVELSTLPTTSWPLSNQDYVQEMGSVASDLVKAILDGKEIPPLKEGLRVSMTLLISEGPVPIEEAIWHQAKEKEALYKKMLQKRGEYDSWQDAVKAVFKNKSDYLSETEQYLHWLEKEVEVKDRNDTTDTLSIRPLRAKALQAYKEVRENIATELYSKKDNSSITLLEKYDIDYTLNELRDGDYEAIDSGNLNEVLLLKNKSALLGTKPSRPTIFPVLKGPGIAEEHGSIYFTKRNLLYANRQAGYISNVITCYTDQPRLINARSAIILAKKDLNKENALATIRIGEEDKYQLQLYLSKK
jgi:hypothetical protein